MEWEHFRYTLAALILGKVAYVGIKQIIHFVKERRKK